jgi:hypothetical protein
MSLRRQPATTTEESWYHWFALIAGVELLRFVLDPIAEYLAASSYAQEFGNDETKWKEFINKVREKGATATGFLSALELVWRADRQSLGWPENLFT